MKCLFALTLLVMSASAQTDDAVAHAAATVAHIHDTMLDPASFVLDGAFVTKPDKHGNVSYCYEFRSHNRMSGYSEGRAVEDGSDHGRLSILTPADDGAFLGYDTGWVAPCKSKNIAKDITQAVAAAAPALYQKSR
jgi:hypothetical protein